MTDISFRLSEKYFELSSPSKQSNDTEKPQVPPRLNSSELQALFRRLDVNGDGELSFKEFKKILNKLNLNSPALQDSLADIFKLADHNNNGKTTGTLEIDEFIEAYNIIYQKFSYENAPICNSEHENWVRATRYGYYCLEDDDDKKYIFECYVGSMANITHKVIYHLPNVPDDEVLSTPPIQLSSIDTDIIELTNYSIETINRLILEDGDRNKKLNTRVMWWVDVSSKKSSEHEVNKFVKAFGISESVKDNFHVVEEPLVHSVGEVVCEPLSSHKSYLGKASVLSMFLQSLYLKNKPLVQRDPAWVEKIPFGLGSYMSSRLAMYYYFSGAECKEFRKLIRRAKEDASELLDRHVVESELRVEYPSIASQTVNSKTHSIEKELHPLNNAHQCLLGLPRRASNDTHPFLIAASDMAVRAPTIVKNNISVHVQDQGYGPMALLSFRTIDSELKDSSSYGKWSLDQHSRAGILGRIMHGVWLKLFELSAREGVANICAELDDSSFSLAIVIASLVQNINMDIAQSMQLWSKQLFLGIEELAVTKHSKHIAIFDVLLSEVKAYVEEFNNAIIPVVSADDEIDDNKAILQKEPSLVNAIGYSYTIKYNAEVQKSRLDGKDVYESCKNLISRSPLPENMKYMTLSAVINTFAINDTKKLLADLLNGIEKLEKKGSISWLELLNKLQHDSDTLKERYQVNLDEKRNFWAFTLGIVTIATFPFAVMTGYFGMNFENMAEPGAILTNDFMPGFPGQYAIWFFTLVIYTAMFVLFLHFRVIDSAL